MRRVEEGKLEVDVHAVRPEELFFDVDERVLLRGLIGLTGQRVQVAERDHVLG